MKYCNNITINGYCRLHNKEAILADCKKCDEYLGIEGGKKLAINDISIDGFRALASTILIRAVTDYQKAKKALEKTTPKTSEEVKRAHIRRILECEKFFKGNWCETLAEFLDLNVSSEDFLNLSVLATRAYNKSK